MSDAHEVDLFGAYAGAVADETYDEMFDGAGVRANYGQVHSSFTTMGGTELNARADSLANSYLDQGVTFGVEGEERPFPLDIVPRLIEPDRWIDVDLGVKQRVKALERFLDDVYGAGEVFSDDVVPRSVVVSSPHFHRVVAGITPPNGVRIHVSGEYLALTRSVAPPPDLVARVDELAGAVAAPGPLARQVCELVYDNVKYVPGSTDLTTTAEQAWESRKGVCQDMAHLSIGALRRAGVPARYVSGYLHPRKEPEVGEAVAGESHAWVEWWDGEWVGFDPTNNIEPGNRHIVVGRGREYRDVAPLRGIFSGGETSKMDAAVTITRVR